VVNKLYIIYINYIKMHWNLIWTLLILAIVGITITAFVLSLISKNDIKNLKSQTNNEKVNIINYSALPQGSTSIVNPTVIFGNDTKAIPTSGLPVPSENLIQIDIPLNSTTWNFTDTHLGTLGKMYIPLVTPALGTSNVYWAVYYSKNGGAEKPLLGAVDFTPLVADQPVTVISLDGITKDDTFSTGDTCTLYIKGVASVTKTITNFPIFDAAMIFGPINV
jgi:hypothetical protein